MVPLLITPRNSGFAVCHKALGKAQKTLGKGFAECNTRQTAHNIYITQLTVSTLYFDVWKPFTFQILLLCMNIVSRTTICQVLGGLHVQMKWMESMSTWKGKGMCKKKASKCMGKN